MASNDRLAWSVASLVAACAPAPSTSEAGSPTESRAVEVACGEEEELRIPRGATRSARSGLSVSFAGSMHDSYDDGRSDLLVELRLSAGETMKTWLPSAFGNARAEMLGHCLRVVEAGADHVVLAIAPR